MNTFDYSIINFFNQFAQRSVQFDNLMVLISDNALLKGGVIIALLWWAWFQEDGLKLAKRNREHILITILASSVGIVGARVLALLLPFRLRPLHNPEITLQFPLEKDFLEGWSSFPSDHAILFFTLATGLFFVSRRLGILAIAHATFVISFPRIYLGLHYPTDILVGALIGIGIALWVNRKKISSTITKLPMRLLEENPSLFYSCFFLVVFEIAEMFNSLRNIAGFIF
jgi:undecaprenyl-diphosphatase